MSGNLWEHTGGDIPFSEAVTFFEFELDNDRDLAELNRRYEALCAISGPLGDPEWLEAGEELLGRLELRRVFGNGDVFADIVRRRGYD